MIVCPNCRYKETDGALFCGDCGSPLADYSAMPQAEQPAARSDATEMVGETGRLRRIYLRMLSTGALLPVQIDDEVTIGRMSEEQAIQPDLDLSPFDAFGNGVSRLHAILWPTGSTLTLMDLTSANGTRLNGQLLQPNVPVPVVDQDVITLGRLKIQVILKKS